MDGKNEMKCTRGSSVWPRLHANGDFNKRSMRGSKAWKSSIPATLLFAIERSVAIINSLPEETHIHVLGASGFESDSDWRILRQGLSKIAPHIKSVHMLLTNSGDGWLVDDKGGYNQTEDEDVEALEGHSQQRLRLGCRGFPEDGLHVKCADVLYSDKYKDRKPDLVFLKDPGANLPTSTAHCSYSAPLTPLLTNSGMGQLTRRSWDPAIQFLLGHNITTIISAVGITPPARSTAEEEEEDDDDDDGNHLGHAVPFERLVRGRPNEVNEVWLTMQQYGAHVLEPLTWNPFRVLVGDAHLDDTDFEQLNLVPLTPNPTAL